MASYDKRPENPAPGDTVARGRCPKCDKPLTPEVWADGWDWLDSPDASGNWCASDGDILCPGPSVDWRERALAAEAVTFVERWEEIERAMQDDYEAAHEQYRLNPSSEAMARRERKSTLLVFARRGLAVAKELDCDECGQMGTHDCLVPRRFDGEDMMPWSPA